MIAHTLARLIVRRPRAVAATLAAIAAASALFLGTSARFDTEILNLLPAEHPAVEGLKRYNNQFAQTRELAFLLESPDPARASEAHEIFIEHISQEPWVLRVLAGTPSADDQLLEPAVIAALILNLPEDNFRDTLAKLEPATISQRIETLAARATAGSPAARTQLAADPLGLVEPAIARVFASADIEGTFELESPCGTAFVIPVITTQVDASAESCEAQMEKVREFLARVMPVLGDGVHVGVTGRSAYVDEIASSMERDLRVTSLASGLCVLLLFWMGFRRLIPLVGIGIVLAVAAISTLATGTLVLGNLNLIAISFCSILFGLGDDFCLLLCQRFYHAQATGCTREAAIARALREAMPGIFCVAVTTAIGFLALCLSGSAGMRQLGALVALGVLLCALFMPAFLFLFVAGKADPAPASTGPLPTWLERASNRSTAILGTAALAGVLLVALALAPWRPLGFDLSPSSLEPRHSPAAITLNRMLALFPNTYEPVMVILDQPTHATLAALDESLAALAHENLAEKIASPSGLWLDPTRAATNASTLETNLLPQAMAALTAAAEQTGLTASSLANTTELANRLSSPTPPPTWEQLLADDSPWWFLVDRMIAPAGSAAIAYFRVPPHLTPDQRLNISERIMEGVPGSFVTGWTQTLVGLAPWATRELLTFGTAVVTLVLGILAFIYRNFKFWAVHVSALLLGLAGTLTSLKLLNAEINLLNVLAFPLIFAVGVDYGTHILLAAREPGRSLQTLAGVVKAVLLSALTTAAGFGALILASNPALSGLGLICGTGVLWAIASALLIITPFAASQTKNSHSPVIQY